MRDSRFYGVLFSSKTNRALAERQGNYGLAAFALRSGVLACYQSTLTYLAGPIDR